MSGKVEQGNLFEETTKGPVTCLGLTFKNDDERREYFREELRKKLPELKKIEGFPIGDDEDIIALSDPPYYTACPNPWMGEFIDEYNSKNTKVDEFKIEPFATDITEGRNEPLYNAHTYHTKVPHKAIMRYILNYTQPGEVVLDGFCGTGMTGVAANLCGDKKEIEALGYKVDNFNFIYKEEENQEGKKVWVKFSKLGQRNAVLNDLSPIASYISYNYNTSENTEQISTLALNILNDIEAEFSWIYFTFSEDNLSRLSQFVKDIQPIDSPEVISNYLNERKSSFGKINYIIWSDKFLCPSCNEDYVYWDEALNKEDMKLKDRYKCPHCNYELSKRKSERAWETYYDDILGETKRRIKREPVLINYKINNKSFYKRPDKLDKLLVEKINNIKFVKWVPTDLVVDGDEISRVIRIDVTNANQFYTRRNLLLLSRLWEKSKNNRILRLAITGILTKTGSLLHNVGIKKGRINLAGALPNTMYIPSNIAERNIIELIKGKVHDIQRANLSRIKNNNIVSTSSTGKNFLPAKDNCIDYIFIDPPFGSNLMYSELNWLWESWLKIRTNIKEEAIENKTQNKNLKAYQELMTSAFSTCYRLLKPGKWMTVEFSNTHASVWNTIQMSIQDSGFVVANVAALNKGQGTYNSQTNPTSVTQDLVITAFKPTNKDVAAIKKQIGTNNSIWLFINQYLDKLPSFKGNKGNAEVIIERTPRILFDKAVAYHVQNGLPITLSSSEFQKEIISKYLLRDGMIFLENQVAEYDKKRILAKVFSQLNFFVSDESSAIEWLRQQLMNKSQTRQDLRPNFMREIQHIEKHELLPELDVLLEQNFLMYDGKEYVPSQVHAYLSTNYKDLRNLDNSDPRLKEKGKNRWYVPDPNKQGDLEKLREKALIKEFEGYKSEIEGNKKKLKQFRTEAIRTGFKKAWSEKDFETIVKVGERLPEKVIHEDDKFLMYFDQAQNRLGK